MKGLGKTLSGIAAISMLLLFYVQGQIALLRISYLMDVQAKKLAQKGEEYRHLKFEVDQLKAPRRLEAKMRELKLELTLPKEVRVVRVPVTSALETPRVEEVKLQPLSKGLLEFLERWVKVAQAKTDS
jgi:hypothetical protein